MKYKVITNESKDILEKQVSDLLEKGWKLQGGICVTKTHHYKGEVLPHHYEKYWYAQALINDNSPGS